jgi:hypothetical protein
MHRHGVDIVLITTGGNMKPSHLSIVLLLATTPVHAHSWYDGQCCKEQDCRQTELHEVERRENGWFVTSTLELIPFDDKRIRRSLDALIHVCLEPKYFSGQQVRCLYIPEMPV